MTTPARPDRRRQRMADQTRHDILQTARQLFARQGYAATSVTDIAREADVAVQTIYARLGSKRGMLMALIDLIDEEADVGGLVADIRGASTPEYALRAEVRLTRVFQERCGDIIGALFAAAAVEPDLAAAVAEGQRRHREGARLTVARLAQLGGLRGPCAPSTPLRSSPSPPPMRHGANSSMPTACHGTAPRRALRYARPDPTKNKPRLIRPASTSQDRRGLVLPAAASAPSQALPPPAARLCTHLSAVAPLVTKRSAGGPGPGGCSSSCSAVEVDYLVTRRI